MKKFEKYRVAEWELFGFLGTGDIVKCYPIAFDVDDSRKCLMLFPHNLEIFDKKTGKWKKEKDSGNSTVTFSFCKFNNYYGAWERIDDIDDSYINCNVKNIYGNKFISYEKIIKGVK